MDLKIWSKTFKIADPEHSPAVARLRRVLDRCKQLACGPAPQPAHVSNAPAPAAAASNVWAEHASTVASSLRSQANYIIT